MVINLVYFINKHISVSYCIVTYTITANTTACLLGGTSQFEITLYPEIMAEITADCANDALILRSDGQITGSNVLFDEFDA
mgnify:CR=1 FL=1